MRFVLQGFCPQRLMLLLVVVGACLLVFRDFCSLLDAFCFANPVVLPLLLSFFSSWYCGWQWLLLIAIGNCPLMPRGCSAVFLLLVIIFLRHGASARLGCSSSSLVWLHWRLSCRVCFLVLSGFCFLLSNCPVQLLLVVSLALCI